MNMRAIPALTLALLGASADAATRYDFSYEGLYYDQSWDDTRDGFYTDAAIVGFFEADDLNGDGNVQVEELTDFAFGYNYGIGGELIHVIGPNTPEYCLLCEVRSFNYSPGGTLAFDAYLSGVRFQQRLSSTGLWSEWYTDYWTLTVTPDTVISVTTVPEPGTSFMFMAGLIGLACAAKVNGARSRMLFRPSPDGSRT